MLFRAWREREGTTPENFLGSHSTLGGMQGTVPYSLLLTMEAMPGNRTKAAEPVTLFSSINPHPPKWILSQSH